MAAHASRRVGTVWHPRKSVTCYPWTGFFRCFPSSVVLLPCLHPTDVWCIPVSFVHSFLLYLHSTLCTKTPGFGTCISILETSHISLNCFSLSENPWNLRLIPWVVFLTAYGYDLDTLLLLLCLSFSNCIMSLKSLLSLVSFLHRTPSFDTLVQTRYDICNSNLCVINYVCHSFWMSSFCFLCAVARPHPSFLNKRSSFVYIIGRSLLWNHSPSEWFSYTTKKRRQKAWRRFL